MPKALTGTLSVFDGRTEKVEHFEHIFKTSFKMFPHVTDGGIVKTVQSLMRGDSLQAFAATYHLQ